jgi:hypothetical protein
MGTRRRGKHALSPLRRRAPLILFRWPTLVAGVAVGIVVLTIAAAAVPLFLSSVGSASLAKDLADVDPSSAGLSTSLEVTFPQLRLARADSPRAGPKTRTDDLLRLQTERLTHELRSRVGIAAKPSSNVTQMGPELLCGFLRVCFRPESFQYLPAPDSLGMQGKNVRSSGSCRVTARLSLHLPAGWLAGRGA